jgi:hypothetical protein
MKRKEYISILNAMTGITEDELETTIRPVFEKHGFDAATRKLKEISGEPLVETHVIIKAYFIDMPTW